MSPGFRSLAFIAYPRRMGFLRYAGGLAAQHFESPSSRFYANKVLTGMSSRDILGAMNPKTYTTGEAAKRVGITRATLQDWIKKRKIAAPKLTQLANIKVRLWTASDVARLKAVKKKIYQEKRPKR